MYISCFTDRQYAPGCNTHVITPQEDMGSRIGDPSPFSALPSSLSHPCLMALGRSGVLYFGNKRFGKKLILTVRVGQGKAFVEWGHNLLCLFNDILQSCMVTLKKMNNVEWLIELCFLINSKSPCDLRVQTLMAFVKCSLRRPHRIS